jgi:hypothetical protein
MGRTVGLLFGSAVLALTLAAGADTQSPRHGEQLAQAWGFRCQTQLGICPISPQPLGSPCWCGAAPGYVIP